MWLRVEQLLAVPQDRCFRAFMRFLVSFGNFILWRETSPDHAGSAKGHIFAISPLASKTLWLCVLRL